MNTQQVSSKKIIGLYVCFSLVLLLITATAGSLSSVYYSEYFSILRDNLKIPFQVLRPIHTFAAMTWIFVSAISFVVYYLFLHEEGNRKKLINQFRVILLLWASAGLISLALLFMGKFTGRAYLIFPPAVSVLIFIGWIFYGYSYFSRINFIPHHWPVYKWMWGTSIFLFIASFLEGHLYLFDFFSSQPTRDMAVEWKSYGALMGSFNLIVYGNLMYLAETITGNKQYAHSKKAFFLYIIGTLNSFTNYVHHTYHLPESSLAKTFSFVVSMLEVIILVKVFYDLWGIKKTLALREKHPVPALFMASATFWTFFQLVLGIIISIPPLNSLIHGTTVVLAHSMGTMIGIDTMAQLAIIAFLQQVILKKNLTVLKKYFNYITISVLNISLMFFWIILISEGVNSSRIARAEGILQSSLTFSSFFKTAFPLVGFILFFCFALISLVGIFDWFKERNTI